jgi:hypothetical protein
MSTPDPQWAEKRRRGLGRYLLIEGVLYTGGPFAVVMQVIGYFLFPGEANSYGEYFASSITWMRFLLHGVLFGLVMGYIKWRRNESGYTHADNTGVE